MKQSQNKKKLQIVLLVLIAVLTLSVGYAAITAINAIINVNGSVAASQENFKVYFVTSNITTGTGTASIDENDNTVAYFDITGLTKKGDKAVATYTILNDSNGVGADISLQLTNSNSEYFKVTETVADSQLQAGDDTTAIVTVEMIKTPIESNVTTSVSAKLVASPIENTSAIGNSPISAEPIPDPVSFTTDSWATIKKAVQDNNTSLYNIGDTKTVTINNVDYTVRIANKTTGEHCGDEDTEYSQTACGFVVEFVDIIARAQMQNSATNVGGYPATNVYYYLKNTLLKQLPEDLQSVIVPTRVISGYGQKDSTDFTSIDSLYLLSAKEVFNDNYGDTASDKTNQLEYYKNNNVTARNFGDYTKKGNKKWWLRSTSVYRSDAFRYVTSTGSNDISNSNSDAYGVAPAFRIG